MGGAASKYKVHPGRDDGESRRNKAMLDKNNASASVVTMLQKDAAVIDSLRTLKDKALTEEASRFAEGALMALLPEEAAASRAVDTDALHVMMSYQWDVQQTVERIVAELQGRGRPEEEPRPPRTATPRRRSRPGRSPDPPQRVCAARKSDAQHREMCRAIEPRSRQRRRVRFGQCHGASRTKPDPQPKTVL